LDDSLLNLALSEFARLFEIAGLNLLLSGDNAVVVGMTIRNLSDFQQKIASAAGISAAALLQIAATLTVAQLLTLPMFSLAAGFVLCVIAIRLLRNNANPGQPAVEAGRDQGVPGAIVTVTVAYFMMSADNIVAIAAVGRGHQWLVTAGLLLSCAMIIPASLILGHLMKRFPIILTAGGAILGWIAGAMLAGALPWLNNLPTARLVQLFISSITAVIVITSPVWWRSQHKSTQCS
jgi:YjbE family integral membrane protein